MHGFILNKRLSPVFLYVNAICRINHVARRMPVRLELFSSAFSLNIVFMFLLYYTYGILRSINSRKRLVLLLYGNQYCCLYFVHKTTYLWPIRSPGGGELSLSACSGVGNRPPSEKKFLIPWGMPGGDGNR